MELEDRVIRLEMRIEQLAKLGLRSSGLVIELAQEDVRLSERIDKLAGYAETEEEEEPVLFGLDWQRRARGME